MVLAPDGTLNILLGVVRAGGCLIHLLAASARWRIAQETDPESRARPGGGSVVQGEHEGRDATEVARVLPGRGASGVAHRSDDSYRDCLHNARASDSRSARRRIGWRRGLCPVSNCCWKNCSLAPSRRNPRMINGSGYNRSMHKSNNSRRGQSIAGTPKRCNSRSLRHALGCSTIRQKASSNLALFAGSDAPLVQTVAAAPWPVRAIARSSPSRSPNAAAIPAGCRARHSKRPPGWRWPRDGDTPAAEHRGT